MFHKHDWKVISEKTFDSPLERLLALGANYHLTHFADMKSRHVTIVKCECGKIKKFETKF